MTLAQFADGFRSNRPDFNRDPACADKREMIFDALDDAGGYHFFDTHDVIHYGEVGRRRGPGRSGGPEGLAGVAVCG